MKNRILAALLIGVLSITALGCSDEAPIAEEITADEPLVLKAGFSTGPADPRVVATELFKEEVEKATDGRIIIEIHPDGELGSDADLISGVIDGGVDITASSAGNFANYANDVGISAFPFLFSTFEEAWAFVDGEVEEKAEEELAYYNIKVLGHYDNGFRCVTTSEKAGPVNSASDMSDLIIRTPENQIVMQTMLSLGAQPKVLEFTLLYDALKNGEFDAQENPIPVIYNNNLYEVQSNLAITNHSYDVMPFVIRKDIWEGLSAEDQQILSDAADKAQAKDRELIKSQTEEYVKELESKGMTITHPNLDEFKAASSSVFDDLGSSYSSEILDAVK